jgi:tRNA A37 methylthiotransferase MiaB
MVGNQPKALIKSLGCISNLADGSGFENYLSQANYALTDNLREADLVVINTCAFNQHKEDEAVAFIDRVRRVTNSDTLVAVCGCLPDINRARLEGRFPDLVFGPKEPEKLFSALGLDTHDVWLGDGPISYSQYSPLKKSIFHSKRLLRNLPWIGDSQLAKRLLGPFFIYSSGVYCIRTVIGCAGHCSYCAIRFAKGRAQSRPLDDVLNSVNRAIESGYTEFVLVGDEITAYGHNQENLDIFDIIGRLLEIEGVETLYLESFEPSFMIARFAELLTVLDSGKIPVFCSSVQSGSDPVLGRMKRLYSASHYGECMQKIRRRHPEILLRSEFIAGFPGESTEDHRASAQLLKELKLDFVDAYEYEDRPNTLASRMPDKIPTPLKRKRRKELLRRHWMNIIGGLRS